MFRVAIPVLRVESSAVAAEFYEQRLGFECCFSYRIDESRQDPCYMGFRRDQAWIHVSSFSGDGVYGSVAHLIVDDVDALHESLRSAGVSIALEPTDQSWGCREMHVEDPAGNRLRFVQEGKGSDADDRSNGAEWQPFENGSTVGSSGSEGGTILVDQDHPEGARITLEQGERPPFAITCGIYGWMVHTRFFATEVEARGAYEVMKPVLAEIAAAVPSQAELDEEALRLIAAACQRFVEEFP